MKHEWHIDHVNNFDGTIYLLLWKCRNCGMVFHVDSSSYRPVLGCDVEIIRQVQDS